LKLKIINNLFFSYILFSLVSCAGIKEKSELSNIWAQQKSPFNTAKPQIFGSVENGCLSGAKSLYASGAHSITMRISRNRYFGHSDLIKFIEDLSLEMKKKNLGKLLVGDLSQPRGGPMLNGHKSHQTGIDVDLWYDTLKEADYTLLQREIVGAQSYIPVKGGYFPNKNWGPIQEKMLKLAASDKRVNRIFVHPTIKNFFCSKYKNSQLSSKRKNKSDHNLEWLRKIRPWWGHGDHFHVRLNCPVESQGKATRCLEQAPVPPGNGCDETLDWWLKEINGLNPPETLTDSENKSKQKSKDLEEILKKLPQECSEIQ
jgi:penicillin-insensitive murein endopeptidase